LLRHGSFDWPEITWLGRLLDGNSHIVFVGAHVGALLVPIAVRSGSPHILAFEPSPANHRLLLANLALNDLARVVVRRKAVGDSPGSLGFSSDPVNTGKSRISPDGKAVVSVTTLDAEIPQDWTGVDLVVMDTEGFEVHAIRGAMQTLKRTRYFYVEFAPGQLREQGSSGSEFIELVASLFESMYAPGTAPRFFPARSYVDHLHELAANDERGTLVRNFLFSNESRPDEALMARVEDARD
jgi:FkbM family methyltransferase